MRGRRIADVGADVERTGRRPPIRQIHFTSCSHPVPTISPRRNFPFAHPISSTIPIVLIAPLPIDPPSDCSPQYL